MKAFVPASFLSRLWPCRIEKEHSEDLQMIYGTVNVLMLILGLFTRRKSFLLGVLGLGYYQAFRVLDVLSRSRHYARGILLFDDLCVLAKCVDPLSNRPEVW